MKTEVGRNWYQSIHFYELSGRHVMASVGGQKMTLSGKTVYQNRSIDTSFDPLRLHETVPLNCVFLTILLNWLYVSSCFRFLATELLGQLVAKS
jgi:hypothetical protein